MEKQVEQIDFNWVVKEYMETSDRLELLIIKDGLSYSEYKDGKLIIHL